MDSTRLAVTAKGSDETAVALRNAATRSAVDGVTTLFTAVGGRTRASLSFRVGSADEPLPLRGITHLVGHLAAAAADQEPGHCPVTVSASTLTFHFSGNALAVANEVGAVCHWVSAASGSRVDGKSLQRAREYAAADQSANPPEHLHLLRRRFGPLDWAAGSYPEFGLTALTPEAITEWVRGYLTAGNAVLAISGTKATTLRVPLPPGDYRPLPDLGRSLLPTPALIAHGDPTVSLSGIIDTDPNRLDRDRATAALTAEIARSRIGYALGRRYGRELTVRGSSMALGRSAVHAVAWADADSERAAKIADIATEALAVLTADKLVEGELQAHIKRRLMSYERAAESAAGAHQLLHRQALGALNDVPWSLALERRLLATSDPDLVNTQLDQLAASTVLAMRPVDPPVRPWPTRAEVPSCPTDGQVFRSRPAYGLTSRGSKPARLIIGSDGITARAVGAADRQQRWDRVVLAQDWDDGRWLLTADDASTFEVTPESWLAPNQIAEQIDSHLPEGAARVSMGHRAGPPAADLRVTDRIAPAWWWAATGVGLMLAIIGALPIWSGSAAWARWLMLALGVVTMLVAGSWALDTALTERRLRSPRTYGEHTPEQGEST